MQDDHRSHHSRIRARLLRRMLARRRLLAIVWSDWLQVGWLRLTTSESGRSPLSYLRIWRQICAGHPWCHGWGSHRVQPGAWPEQLVNRVLHEPLVLLSLMQVLGSRRVRQTSNFYLTCTFFFVVKDS